MKKSVSLLLIGLADEAAGCGSAPAEKATATAETPAATTAAASTASSADVAAEATAPQPAAPPRRPAAPYEVRGIVDPGMNNEIAMALKIPTGWQMQQSFTRKWNGATPINQIYVHLTAPDGQRQIEFLPEQPYYFVDGQMARYGRQQAAMMGMPQRTNEYEMAPMSALAYLKRVLMPRLTQRGLHLEYVGEHEQRLSPQGTMRRSSAYIDGRLPNGRLARIECTVNVNPTNVNGDTYYNWTALPSITQATSNLPATFAYVTTARASVVLNPSWLRQNQQLVNNGQRSNQIEDGRRRAIQQDFQEYQRKTYKEIADNKSKSQARINEAFDDGLRGDTKFEAPTTGERVTVRDDYNHVYSDGQGTLLKTNAPLDASNVHWQELQRVELKNY